VELWVGGQESFSRIQEIVDTLNGSHYGGTSDNERIVGY